MLQPLRFPSSVLSTLHTQHHQSPVLLIAGDETVSGVQQSNRKLQHVTHRQPPRLPMMTAPTASSTPRFMTRQTPSTVPESRPPTTITWGTPRSPPTADTTRGKPTATRKQSPSHRTPRLPQHPRQQGSGRKAAMLQEHGHTPPQMVHHLLSRQPEGVAGPTRKVPHVGSPQCPPLRRHAPSPPCDELGRHPP
jgi:hypothetical protein